MKAIAGKKMGMTQIFNQEGNRIAVTLIKTESDISSFAEGEKISVRGISKGKGFAGGMKRWGWAGGGASHGSMSHRRIGSVGAGTSPGRIWKGKTMPGRMGNQPQTIKGITIIKIDKEAGMLALKGSVPGARSKAVYLKKEK